MRLCIFALILILTCSVTSNAQWENSYRPLKLHSASSTELIESLKKQLQLELNSMAYAPNFEIVKRINITRTDAIVKMVKRGEFIHDDSLESYVNNVLKQLIKNNEIEDYPKRVLILNSPTVNAFCYGQGIYIVTVSLLGRISNEHQLAFILAHELSHDVLGHIKSRISREAEIDFNRRSKEQVKKIFNGTLEAEDIQAYKKLIYDFTKYTRQKELQADSMGLSMMSGADYNEEDAYATLDILDSALKPKENIGVELFLPLHSKEYPLQDFGLTTGFQFSAENPKTLTCIRWIPWKVTPTLIFEKSNCFHT